MVAFALAVFSISLVGRPAAPARGLASSVVLTPQRTSNAFDRRDILHTASSLSTAALVAALTGFPTSPARAAVVAPVRDEAELKESVILIARVIEATEQEERLINSGKYKDLQRKSVKNAATMMLENYALPRNLVRAAIFVPQDKITEGTRFSQEATEALNQIIGYFPAELSVGELERPQKEFVLRALAAARTNLVSFIALLPPDIVKSALDQVRKENELNAQDYQRIFGEPMLNVPSEPGSAKPAPKPEPAEGAAPKPAKRGSPFAAARKSKSPE